MHATYTSVSFPLTEFFTDGDSYNGTIPVLLNFTTPYRCWFQIKHSPAPPKEWQPFGQNSEPLYIDGNPRQSGPLTFGPASVPADMLVPAEADPGSSTTSPSVSAPPQTTDGGSSGGGVGVEGGASSSSVPTDQGSKGPDGTSIGIGVGVALGVVIIVAAAVFFARKWMKSVKAKAGLLAEKGATDTPPSAAGAGGSYWDPKSPSSAVTPVYSGLRPYSETRGMVATGPPRELNGFRSPAEAANAQIYVPAHELSETSYTAELQGYNR